MSENEEFDRAAWFSVAMNAAASLEDAANCLADADAKRATQTAAEFTRKRANDLWPEARLTIPQAAESAIGEPNGDELTWRNLAAWHHKVSSEAKPIMCQGNGCDMHDVCEGLRMCHHKAIEIPKPDEFTTLDEVKAFTNNAMGVIGTTWPQSDDRAAFEAWFDNRPDEYGLPPDPHPVREDGTYEWGFKQEMWECWQAATHPTK